MDQSEYRYRPSTSATKRWTGWAVLIALLFVHIKVASGGCLISAALAQSSGSVTQSAQSNPCSEPSVPDNRVCLKHCAQSTDTPKPTLDLPQYAHALVAVFSTPAYAPNVATLESVRWVAPSCPDPPPYLRFLRLLN